MLWLRHIENLHKKISRLTFRANNKITFPQLSCGLTDGQTYKVNYRVASIPITYLFIKVKQNKKKMRQTKITIRYLRCFQYLSDNVELPMLPQISQIYFIVTEIIVLLKIGGNLLLCRLYYMENLSFLLRGKIFCFSSINLSLLRGIKCANLCL